MKSLIKVSTSQVKLVQISNLGVIPLIWQDKGTGNKIFLTSNLATILSYVPDREECQEYLRLTYRKTKLTKTVMKRKNLNYYLYFFEFFDSLVYYGYVDC